MAQDGSNILAIDPGCSQSAFVLLCDDALEAFGVEDNFELLRRLRRLLYTDKRIAVIEHVESFGMPVGKEIFETVWWSGRYYEAWTARGGEAKTMTRREVKLQLCNTSSAKDANVRQALLDRFPRTGGGKTPQVGIKKQPGPLFGVSRDVWAALAVAVAWKETRG